MLPEDLLSAVKEGRAVLFLGSGASRGGLGFARGQVPDGQGLADILAEEFLGSGYKGLDLKRTYDLACSVRDVRTVQAKIHELLYPVQPAPFHRLIPTFAWAGLAGTNYDLIVERAYELCAKPVQRLVTNVKDGDGSTERVGNDGVLYVKLHGSIANHADVDPPLIASTEQFIYYKEGRAGQFATFLEWAKRRTLIFCGYSFADPNLRTLLDEIIEEGDKRPRHYMVAKGILPLEQQYWSDRRIIAIDSTFEEFMTELDKETPATTRVLGALQEIDSTSFTRYITLPDARESEALRLYLRTLIEHVPPDLDPEAPNPTRFYSGFDLGWSAIAADLDVRLPVVDQLLSEHMAGVPKPSKQPIVLLKGHAGSGKTVALRRLCYESARRHQRLCFYVTRRHSIDVEMFDEMFSLTSMPIYLFIDNVADHRVKIVELIARAQKRGATITVICTETFNTWNTACEELESYVNHVAEMRYWGDESLRRLIGRLDQHGCLGHLAPMNESDRLRELNHVFGRQILVALLEATHGLPLHQLIVEEYSSIEPPDAKLLYLDICSLHRFGPPVRAGLISRIHNIDFSDFADRLFRPLERIVTLREDKRSGDYVYEARHTFIAHEVYNGALVTKEQKFDNIIRIIAKLNPNFSYDMEVLGKIVRADNLEGAVGDATKIRQIYDVAVEALGERAVIFHQRGVFELHQAVSLGKLDAAQSYLERALSLEPYNRSIKHSLSEVDLKRSRVATDPAERAAWRRSAIDRATALIKGSKSPYPHHTLLKADIDSVREALQALDADTTEAATLRLGDAIAGAESTLKRGLQQFPNEAVLLSEEGELSKVLSQAVRAEGAFQKAFEANPRSTLTAKRLARIKRSHGAFGEALDILRTCLEYNPSSQELHYDLSMTMMEAKPDSDTSDSDTLLFHLRRSFATGESNRQAQFWYARQLSIAKRIDESKELFSALSDAAIPFREKTEVRGRILGPEGTPQRFSGAVVSLGETYGFVQCDLLDQAIFFPFGDVPAPGVDYLWVGTSVTFQVGFTLRGAIACNIEL
ncbi:SIR2 family protein [Devosia sp.]|uniref:P-loop NTPase n=1 Tax=Devosia sp. TaxID=1871048 RepID=UPI003F72E782